MTTRRVSGTQAREPGRGLAVAGSVGGGVPGRQCRGGAWRGPERGRPRVRRGPPAGAARAATSARAARRGGRPPGGATAEAPGAAADFGRRPPPRPSGRRAARARCRVVGLVGPRRRGRPGNQGRVGGADGQLDRLAVGARRGPATGRAPGRAGGRPPRGSRHPPGPPRPGRRTASGPAGRTTRRAAPAPRSSGRRGARTTSAPSSAAGWPRSADRAENVPDGLT